MIINEHHLEPFIEEDNGRVGIILEEILQQTLLYESLSIITIWLTKYDLTADRAFSLNIVFLYYT